MQEDQADLLVMRFLIPMEERRHRIVEGVVGKYLDLSDLDPAIDALQGFPACPAKHIVFLEDLVKRHPLGQGGEA